MNTIAQFRAAYQAAVTEMRRAAAAADAAPQIESLHQAFVEARTAADAARDALEHAEAVQRARDAHGAPARDAGSVANDARPMNADYAGPAARLGDWLANEVRSLVTGTGSGQYVVPDAFWGGIFNRLAASSVGLASGFSVIDLSESADRLHIPRITADAASAWTSEGSAITATDPTISEVIAIPRKLAALVQVSNEVLDDSAPSVLEIVMSNLFQSIGLKLDLGFFEGSGTPPEITGMKGVSGIGTVSMGTNGASPSNLDAYADAIGTLSSANAEATAIVMHPRTWQTLSKLKEQSSGNNKPLLQESAGPATAGIRRSLYGVPVYLTSQLSITETQGTSTDCSSAYVYQADQVVAVRRKLTAVEVDRSRLFNQDMSEIRAITRWDMVVPQPAAIVRILGIRP